ncbi:hypothetical protein [Paraburkholderia mimosarum]|uniref:hypothetical protein n=1 Tax=Paraburkholderia mimosarum TaxID=312026 RepID=UPI0004128A55|nr:hypothetical protein [Paraburkholderia mimosarum]
MKYRGQYTVNSSMHPLLCEFLASESSAKKRSAAITWFAEFGCALHKLARDGRLDASGAALIANLVPSQVILQQLPAGEELTNQLLENAIGGFSFSSMDLQDTE